MSLSSVIGDILPQAVAVAISPVPIIAVILMLFSAKARANGIAFAAGWVVALTVVGSLVLVAANAGKVAAGGEAPQLHHSHQGDLRPAVSRTRSQAVA